MRVTFWGVRGTFPATGAAHARYGGDTMCIGIEAGGTDLILDAGSGLRDLGAALAQRTGPIAAHIVVSHLHLDHLLGLTQFAPFWRDDARVHLYAPAECLDEGGEDALFSVMRPPLFPVDAGLMPAAIGLQPFPLGGNIDVSDEVRIDSIALHHPGACAGIVVRADGRKLAYVTDHEHGDAAADERLAAAAEGADLLIYDATFTEAEMQAHRGWGHSSWEAGLRLKQQAGVKLLALVHHHPDRTGEELDAFAEAAARLSSNVFFARQGLSLAI
jgi:phosphoribosyl 1,2-cyclic phosphodiesterase